MTKNVNALRFDEDAFDLTAHKRAADAVAREKARVRRIRRQVMVGKIALAAAALVIFILLAFVAFELMAF